MSFSTNFQPIFQHSGDHYYDNIYSAFPEPPEACAQAELSRLNRALIVPEFADSTPLDLFDRDGVLVEAAPHWSWESARVTVVTGGEGSLTQWVHCEFVVSFEAICPVITHQVCGEFF